MVSGDISGCASRPLAATSAPALHRRANQADLEIAEDVFADEAVQGLLDQWIVPSIVDNMVQKILESQRE